MNLSFYLASKIGGKGEMNGRSGRLSNKIAAISVAVSIAVMIVSIAVLRGFSNEIREKSSGFSGDMTLSTLGVDIMNEQYPVPGDLAVIPHLDSLDFIRQIQKVSYRSGLIKTDDQIQGVVFKGVDSLYNLDFFGKHLYAGELPKYGNGYSEDILISKRLADLLGYAVGDKLLAYFIGEEVKVRKFNISGIYDAQLEEVDKVLVVADIKHISRLNGWQDGEVSGFEILLDGNASKSALERVEEEISTLVDQYAQDGDDAISLTSLREKYFILFDWLHLLDINVFIILALMIAVAGVNMVSGILIVLFENISKIGLLKALGMRNADISKVFLIQAASIVGKGLVWGNAIAGALCYLEWKYKFIALDPANYFVKYVPVNINLTTVLGVNVAAFVIIMAILLIPCHFIYRVSPAKTLMVK